MQRLGFILCLLLCAVAQSALAQSGCPVPPTDTTLDQDITGDCRLKSGPYTLSGIVYVGDGTCQNSGTLSLEKGTVILAEPGSALVVTRCSQLYAWGTVEKPVILTAAALSNAPFARECLTVADRGLWGGLIVLGRAAVDVPGGAAQIEVLTEASARTLYGGGASPRNADSSGVLRYLSVRHAGGDLGRGDVNTVTLGGVGSDTTIDHVESYCGKDDGLEMFGGTVSAKYLAVAFNGDDSFDLDQGYRGNLQFLFSINGSDTGTDTGDSCFEVGSAAPILSNVNTSVANATCIGSNNNSATDNDPAVTVRGTSRLQLDNNILEQYPKECVEIEAGSTTVARSNAWFDFALYPPPPATTQPFPACVANSGTLTQTQNRNLHAQLRGISRSANGGLDPRLRTNSPSFVRTQARTLPVNGFFETTRYLGAFDPQELWLCSWTALNGVGYLPNTVCP